MSEWEFLKIKDLVSDGSLEKPLDGNHGGLHPKGQDFVTSGIPFVMASDINNSQIDLVGCKFISKQQALSLRKGFAKTGDVLLTHKATLGRTSLVPPLKTDFIMLTPQVTYYRVRDKSRINNHYLKYYFDTPDFQKTLANHGDAGSTRAYIGITAQHDLPVILPPINEQKAIASVLSSLDEKIDLLHRQNKTLESMAETLFRQWFIKGVQEGWSETTIGEVFTLNGGSTPSTKNDDFWDGDISWTSPRDLSGSESIFLMSTERKITSLGLKRISSGLLPVRTLLMSSRAPIGYLSITDIPVAINQGYIAIRENPDYHSEYMYLWCKLNMETIKNSGNGSVFQEISKSSFRNLTFIEPPKEKVQSFNELTRDLFEKNRLNTKQIRRLERLRDTLLPKLMSGEVRVQYAEEAIASVA